MNLSIFIACLTFHIQLLMLINFGGRGGERGGAN